MSDFIELKKEKEGSKRRWFMSNDYDLIVFNNEQGEIKEFQFCYDKNKHEQMLSWSIEAGYSHMAIDDGDVLNDMGHKRAPLVVPNGSYSVNAILNKFLSASNSLPKNIEQFVKTKIINHPNYEQ